MLELFKMIKEFIYKERTTDDASEILTLIGYVRIFRVFVLSAKTAWLMALLYYALPHIPYFNGVSAELATQVWLSLTFVYALIYLNTQWTYTMGSTVELSQEYTLSLVKMYKTGYYDVLIDTKTLRVTDQDKK